MKKNVKLYSNTEIIPAAQSRMDVLATTRNDRLNLYKIITKSVEKISDYPPQNHLDTLTRKLCEIVKIRPNMTIENILADKELSKLIENILIQSPFMKDGDNLGVVLRVFQKKIQFTNVLGWVSIVGALESSNIGINTDNIYDIYKIWKHPVFEPYKEKDKKWNLHQIAFKNGYLSVFDVNGITEKFVPAGIMSLEDISQPKVLNDLDISIKDLPVVLIKIESSNIVSRGFNNYLDYSLCPDHPSVTDSYGTSFPIAVVNRLAVEHESDFTQYYEKVLAKKNIKISVEARYDSVVMNEIVLHVLNNKVPKITAYMTDRQKELVSDLLSVMEDLNDLVRIYLNICAQKLYSIPIGNYYDSHDFAQKIFAKYDIDFVSQEVFAAQTKKTESAYYAALKNYPDIEKAARNINYKDFEKYVISTLERELYFAEYPTNGAAADSVKVKEIITKIDQAKKVVAGYKEAYLEEKKLLIQPFLDAVDSDKMQAMQSEYKNAFDGFLATASSDDFKQKKLNGKRRILKKYFKAIPAPKK